MWIKLLLKIIATLATPEEYLIFKKFLSLLAKKYPNAKKAGEKMGGVGVMRKRKKRDKAHFNAAWYEAQLPKKLHSQYQNIIDKKFRGQALTAHEKAFKEWYEAAYGDTLINERGMFVNRAPFRAKRLTKAQEKKRWYKANSSWIVKYRWLGDERKVGKKATLQVIMKRGRGAYSFPRFPYEEYVGLRHTKAHIGTRWWRLWLWRYSTNPMWKFRKKKHIKGLWH